MPVSKKKKNESETATKELTKAERFYVGSHPGSTAEQLAEELGVDASLVQAVIDEGKPKGGKKTFFAKKEQTVSMTAAQSQQDETPARSRRKNWGPDVHIIDPSQPVY